MSYYDWEHLDKYLHWQPVTQDTVENTKALSITPVDWIKSGVVYLEIPAQYFTPIYTLAGGTIPPVQNVTPLIIGQYNYSVGDPITIVNPNDIAFDTLTSGNIFYCALCVRFRVGNTVTRYRLDKTVNPSFKFGLLPFPVYTNQTIKGNFTIEVWQLAATTAGLIGLPRTLYINTGRIYFKSCYEDVGNIISPSEIVDSPDLETALPENVPTTVLDSGPWLTN